MFKLIFLKLMVNPLISKLCGRLINRYTSSGIIIVLMQLESLGILPKGVNQAVEGLAAKEILLYLGLAVGAYLIMHKPQLKNKVERRKEELELTKIELELAEARKTLKKSKSDGNK